MQKLLLRITCLLLAMVVGAAAARIHKFFVSRTTIPQTDQRVLANVDSETVWRCEETPNLPPSIKALLDRSFPGWQFPVVTDDDCHLVKTTGGREAYAQLIRGDFDGDGRFDYAVLIEEATISDERGPIVRPDVYIVTFLARRDDYKMRIVTHEGGTCLQLMRKGDRDYDYEAQREFSYAHDTIFSGRGMGGTSYLYENGKFRAIITSD